MSDIIKKAFENIDPEAEKRLDEKLKNGSESFGLYDVSSSFYCQSDIEDNGICDEQCEHCKEYYKPLENES